VNGRLAASALAEGLFSLFSVRRVCGGCEGITLL
jgi:hypothetical protein